MAGVVCPLLLIADDIVVASTDPQLTQRLVTSLGHWCDLSGLTVNVDKTCTLVGGVVSKGGKEN